MRHKNNEFNEKYCDLLIEQMSQGKTMVQFCAHIGKSKQTFYAWLDRYKEFSAAYEIAKVKAEAYWTERADENVDNPDFNFGHIRWLMGNRFGVTKHRNQRLSKYINTKDLIGSFNKLVKASNSGEINIEELRLNVSILLELANLKEKTELEERMNVIEEALKDKDG